MKMDEKEIIEGNFLISEFMGAKIHHTGFTDGFTSYTFDGVYGFKIKNLIYHCDYNTLMPVVEKIAYETKHPVAIYISHVQKTATIYELHNEHSIVLEGDTIHKPIEAIWMAVVEFLKIYKLAKK